MSPRVARYASGMQRQLTAEQRATFIAEVRKAVGDPALDAIVEWAFDEAWALGFEVFHIPAVGQDGEESSVDWDNRAIYVSPNGLSGPARLWDLLHEIGHAEQGRPREGYKSARTAECFERETDAWRRAWARACHARPELAAYDTVFRAHASAMASSYAPTAAPPSGSSRP